MSTGLENRHSCDIRVNPPMILSPFQLLTTVPGRLREVPDRLQRATKGLFTRREPGTHEPGRERPRRVLVAAY